jgi:hypothetical protein
MSLLPEGVTEREFFVEQAACAPFADRDLLQPIPTHRDRHIESLIRVDVSIEAPKVVIPCFADSQCRAAALAERVVGERHCIRIGADTQTPIPASGILILAHAHADAKAASSVAGRPSLLSWATFFQRHISSYVVFIEHCTDDIHNDTSAIVKSVFAAIGTSNWMIRNPTYFRQECMIQRAEFAKLQSHRFEYTVQQPAYFVSSKRFVFKLRGTDAKLLDDLMMMHIAHDMTISARHRAIVVPFGKQYKKDTNDTIVSAVPGDDEAHVSLMLMPELIDGCGKIATMCNTVDTSSYVRRSEAATLQWPIFSAHAIQTFADRMKYTALHTKTTIFICGAFSSHLILEIAKICASDISLTHMYYTSCAVAAAKDVLAKIAMCDIFVLIGTDPSPTALRPELVLAGILCKTTVTNTCPTGPDQFIWKVKENTEILETIKDLIPTLSDNTSELYTQNRSKANAFEAFCMSSLSSGRLAARIADMTSRTSTT